MFFAQIMIKFKKPYNLKIISILLAGVFLLNSTLYAIDLPKKAHLRKPLMASEAGKSEDEARLMLAAKKFIEDALKELDNELLEKQKELKELFKETLSPLADNNITVARIKDLLGSREEEIFDLIRQIREILIKTTIIVDDVDYYVNLRLHEDISPDSGLCFNLRNCLMSAMQDIDLSPEPVDIPEGTENLRVHRYFTVEGNDGIIAIDIASGQFIPENIGRVGVELFSDYRERIEGAIFDSYDFRRRNGKDLLLREEELRDQFERIGTRKFLIILEIAEILLSNL